MARVWLDADAVAERLGVCRKTAVAMMYQMDHSVISGTVRKRIRVSEDALDAWMMRNQAVRQRPASTGTAGTKKKLARR